MATPGKVTKTAPKIVAAPAVKTAPKTVAPTKAPTPADKATDKEEHERVAQNDKFVYLGNIAEGAKKLAPQAQAIVNLIQAEGKNGVTRATLVTNMTGVVQTRQPLGRILSYYQKALVEGGYVSIEKAARPEKPEAAEAADENSAEESEA